jgi:hypothetical protein
LTPQAFLFQVIDPGLVFLEELGGPAINNDVRRFLLAVAMQESGTGLSARYQNAPSVSPGPARGFYQFEQGGGVAGVLAHTRSKALALRACAACEVAAQSGAVWRAIEGHDRLATAFARLLVWTDPQALPTTERDAWSCYMRLWRPGKPHPENWPINWELAGDAVNEPPQS